MTNDPAISEELTAYLDGELAPNEVLRVEQRLGSDPFYLAEMQSLQRTWDLFDQLPTEQQADDAFVRTTMEMVVREAATEIKRKQRRNWRRWIPRAILVAIPLALFAISYGAMRIVTTAPHRQLVNNLRLIENLDAYRQLDADLDFLLQLNEKGLFAETPNYDINSASELPTDWFVYNDPGALPSRETIEQRRQRIETLDLDAKILLRKNFERFEQLTPAEQQSLQNFHNELSSHPDRDQLLPVMAAYAEWLKTLVPAEQVSLRDNKDTTARVNEISNILARQTREAFGRSGPTKLPTPRDREYLFEWYRATINHNQDIIRARFPQVIVNYQVRNQGAAKVQANELMRFASRRPLSQLVSLWMRIDRDSIQDILLGRMEDIYLLQHGLSFEARAILEEQSPESQKNLLLNWLEAASQAETTLSHEVLQQFYEQLPLKERDELDQLAPENWISTLTQKYWQHHRAQRRSVPIDSLSQPPEDWELFLQNGDF